MHIETQRLTIRDFTLEDALDLYEILGDAKCMEYCEPAYNFPKTEAFLHSFCIDRGGAVAAVLKETGKLIGYILFCEVEPDIYELGWFFNRSFWRQGYAYEACKAVLSNAFTQRKAKSVFAETVDSIRSLGLMEKLGMRPAQEHSSSEKMYVYSLTAKEWSDNGDQV